MMQAQEFEDDIEPVKKFAFGKDSMNDAFRLIFVAILKMRSKISPNEIRALNFEDNIVYDYDVKNLDVEDSIWTKMKTILYEIKRGSVREFFIDFCSDLAHLSSPIEVFSIKFQFSFDSQLTVKRSSEILGRISFSSKETIKHGLLSTLAALKKVEKLSFVIASFRVAFSKRSLQARHRFSIDAWTAMENAEFAALHCEEQDLFEDNEVQHSSSSSDDGTQEYEADSPIKKRIPKVMSTSIIDDHDDTEADLDD